MIYEGGRGERSMPTGSLTGLVRNTYSTIWECTYGNFPNSGLKEIAGKHCMREVFMSKVRKLQRIIRGQKDSFCLRLCGVEEYSWPEYSCPYSTDLIIFIDPVKATWVEEEWRVYPDAPETLVHESCVYQLSNKDIRRWLSLYGLNLYRELRYSLYGYPGIKVYW